VCIVIGPIKQFEYACRNNPDEIDAAIPKPQRIFSDYIGKASSFTGQLNGKHLKSIE